MQRLTNLTTTKRIKPLLSATLLSVTLFAASCGNDTVNEDTVKLNGKWKAVSVAVFDASDNKEQKKLDKGMQGEIMTINDNKVTFEDTCLFPPQLDGSIYSTLHLKPSVLADMEPSGKLARFYDFNKTATVTIKTMYCTHFTLKDTSHLIVAGTDTICLLHTPWAIKLARVRDGKL